MGQSRPLASVTLSLLLWEWLVDPLEIWGFRWDAYATCSGITVIILGVSGPYLLGLAATITVC